jgi:hypothetical protein
VRSGLISSQPLPTYDLAPRETETILTFSNTLDQMAAYGERDLRRFPHAHILYEQAYTLGAKLQRNAEEKSTKQREIPRFFCFTALTNSQRCSPKCRTNSRKRWACTVRSLTANKPIPPVRCKNSNNGNINSKCTRMLLLSNTRNSSTRHTRHRGTLRQHRK